VDNEENEQRDNGQLSSRRSNLWMIFGALAVASAAVGAFVMRKRVRSDKLGDFV